jgi:hypothetical protein
MIRNCFVREEDGGLVLCSGLPHDWCDQERPFSFGPAPTVHGRIWLLVTPKRDSVEVSWRHQWHVNEPNIEIRLSGFPPLMAAPGQATVQLDKKSRSPSLERGIHNTDLQH